MIENLKQIEDKMLLDLLVQPDKWNTMLINYHLPLVERCWIQLGNYRLNLHFIHKCETKDALYHNHRWPSAMHVLYGKYEMGLANKYLPGFGELYEIRQDKFVDETVKSIGMTFHGEHEYDNYVKEICKFEMTGDAYYEMLNPEGWHYVRPVGDVCATVMLTGKPWEESKEFITPGKLEPLSMQKKLIMLKWFEEYYRNRIHGQKVAENEHIQKGDWVKLDINAMSASDKRGMEQYFGVLGFVIGRDKNFIDVRFKNDRTKVHSKNLILMNPADNPTNVEAEKKKLDDMAPENWPDDSEDEI